MVKTKPLDQVVKKWTDSASRIPTAYAQGVQNAAWQANATSGQALYTQRMADPNVLARRAKGIAKVSDAAWQSAAVNKGAARIGPGVQAAQGKFQAGMQNVLNTIGSVTLAARTTDPMANIDNRVKPIAQALHNMKMGS